MDGWTDGRTHRPKNYMPGLPCRRGIKINKYNKLNPPSSCPHYFQYRYIWIKELIWCGLISFTTVPISCVTYGGWQLFHKALIWLTCTKRRKISTKNRPSLNMVSSYKIELVLKKNQQKMDLVYKIIASSNLASCYKIQSVFKNRFHRCKSSECYVKWSPGTTYLNSIYQLHNHNQFLV